MTECDIWIKIFDKEKLMKFYLYLSEIVKLKIKLLNSYL